MEALVETLLHYGLREVAGLVVLRLATRWLSSQLHPEAWFDLGEGLFILTFFSYLCHCITLALSPDFYAPSATDVRCLRVSDELLYCLRLYFASNIADMPFLLVCSVAKLYK